MSDKYKIEFSPAALEDLSNIFLYIANELKERDIAEKQVNRIRNKLQTLDMFPEAFPIVNWEPWKSACMHKLPINNYVAYYQVDNSKKVVKIVRIFYGGMNIEEVVKGNTE